LGLRARQAARAPEPASARQAARAPEPAPARQAARATEPAPARREAHATEPASARPAGLLPLFAIATAAIWAQAVLGGMVSTNHASLACPDWPTCNGRWLPELTGLVGLQMAHRFGAYLLVALLGWVALRAGSAPDAATRNLGRVLFLLVLAQGAIGVANVLLGIPVWVSALHLGNAALMLALSLIGTFRLAAMDAGERATSRPPRAGTRPQADARVRTERMVAR